MKIVFLDFDGVIRVPVFSGDGKPEAEFCPDRMRRVASLAREHDARIVISSDWRLRKSRDSIVQELDPSIPEELIFDEEWCTPMIFGDIPRGLEIKTWLGDHDVDAYVILDDYPADKFPGMEDRHIKCNLLDGFSEEKLAEASRLLASIQ